MANRQKATSALLGLLFIFCSSSLAPLGSEGLLAGEDSSPFLLRSMTRLPLFDLLPAATGWGRDIDYFRRPDLLLLAPSHRLSAGFRYEDLLREKVGERRNSANRSSYLLESYLPLGRGELLLEGGVQGFGLDLLLKDDRTVKLDSETSSFQTSFATSLAALNLDLGASLKMSDRDGKGNLQGALSTSYHPLPQVSLGGNLSSSFQGWDLFLQIEDQGINLPICYRLPQLGFHLDLRDIWRFSLSGGISFSDLEAESGGSASGEFRMEPRGKLSSYLFSSKFSLSPILDFSCCWSRNLINIDGDLYNLDQRFGKLTAGDLNWDRFDYLVSLSPGGIHHLGLLFTRENISANLRGHMESWPFTPTLIDLLGQRFYFHGEAEVKVDLWGLIYGYSRLPGFELEADLRWMAIYPRGEITTWNPELFGFGITNLERYILTYQRVNALNLTLKLEKSWHNFTAAYLFSQFVPVYTKKTKSEGEKPEPSPSLQVEKKSTYGGGFHRVTISYPL